MTPQTVAGVIKAIALLVIVIVIGVAVSNMSSIFTAGEKTDRTKARQKGHSKNVETRQTQHTARTDARQDRKADKKLQQSCKAGFWPIRWKGKDYDDCVKNSGKALA